MSQTNESKRFDAVEVIRLSGNAVSIDASYSHYPDQQIKVVDVGVVTGDWLNNQLRVEAVDDRNAIV